ncbi:hypothetical protein DM01DRAFT_1286451 [Hesseltinella vesiculosa]|uniref:Eisosome component PIL1-domain-containing protein n=1 Tax=Hesseltinella vesiculosa TaxID=101127 RepID=A0A1X2GJ20_9FUNG|nr:hypothetical protein DM01DRAFT_1286451 [Hesseltinella vesiculosa]
MVSFIHSLVNKSTPYDPNLLQFLDSQKKVSTQWLQLADQQRIAANDLMLFGRPLGDDLTDVTSKTGNILNKWVEVINNFSATCDQFQMTMKSIADRESTQHRSREKVRKLEDSLISLERDRPAALDKHAELKQRLDRAKEANAVDECELDNFKRVVVREAIYLFLNGMHEFASKTDIISCFGKYIADELEVTPIKITEERRPYRATEHTSRIVKDASANIDNWKPDDAKLRRTLTSHHGTNPLIAQQKALPPAPSMSTSSKSNTSTTNYRSSPKPPLTTQDSAYSLHKPDALDAFTFVIFWSLSFSIGLPDHQKLYQFYADYSPPKTYEEMTRMYQSNAVFHPTSSPGQSGRIDAGGFALPNNQFLQPQPSQSTSTTSNMSESSALGHRHTLSNTSNSSLPPAPASPLLSPHPVSPVPISPRLSPRLSPRPSPSPSPSNSSLLEPPLHHNPSPKPSSSSSSLRSPSPAPSTSTNKRQSRIAALRAKFQHE